MGVHGHGLSVGHAMTNAVMLDLAPLPVSAVETQERMIAPMKVLHVIDYIFRGMALVWLLPFMYLWFVLSIMASDAPGTGILPTLILWGINAAVGLLIVYSSLSPEVLTRRIAKFRKTSFVLGRIPAYLMAYYGAVHGVGVVTALYESLLT